MEIFNSIWTILSTPNEWLLSILTTPLFFVENFLTLTLFTSLLNITINKTQKLIYVLSTSCVSILSMFFISNPFNVIFNYFLAIIISCIILKLSFLKSVVAIISSGLIFNLIGALILNPYLTFFNISSAQLATIPIYRLFYICIMYTFISIIIVILKNRKLYINFLDDTDKKTKFVLLSNLILGIITILVQSITLFYYVDKLPIFITFLMFYLLSNIFYIKYL